MLLGNRQTRWTDCEFDVHKRSGWICDDYLHQSPGNIGAFLYTFSIIYISFFQRKFVRECAFFPATNFYGSFREWLDLNYQHFNDETWNGIMDEDATIDYKNTGSGVDSTEQVVESEDS